jgi:UDP-3-O-acyl-N-acetylglucosamine deacetylase
LDLIGDLALLGAPVLGHIVAHRPSHRGNVGLARTVAHSCRLETASAGHP